MKKLSDYAKEMLADADKMEAEAAKLREAAAKLMNGSGPEPTPGPPGRKFHSASARLRQIKDFLALNGPSRRKEIIDGSGVPKGTISMLLKPERGFRQTGDGRWELAEEEGDAE